MSGRSPRARRISGKGRRGGIPSRPFSRFLVLLLVLFLPGLHHIVVGQYPRLQRRQWLTGPKRHISVVVPRQDQELFSEPQPVPAGRHSARSKKERALLVMAWKSRIGIFFSVCTFSLLVQARTAIPAKKSPENAGVTSVLPIAISSFSISR